MKKNRFNKKEMKFILDQYELMCKYLNVGMTEKKGRCTPWLAARALLAKVEMARIFIGLRKGSKDADDALRFLNASHDNLDHILIGLWVDEPDTIRGKTS